MCVHVGDIFQKSGNIKLINVKVIDTKRNICIVCLNTSFLREFLSTRHHYSTLSVDTSLPVNYLIKVRYVFCFGFFVTDRHGMVTEPNIKRGSKKTTGCVEGNEDALTQADRYITCAVNKNVWGVKVGEKGITTTAHKMYSSNNGCEDINTTTAPVSPALNSHSFVIYTCQKVTPV